MTGTADGTEPVLVLAPLGRDAELACSVLTGAGLTCRACRDATELDEVRLDELNALVLAEELLTPPTIETLTGRLDAQEHWSSLRVVLLVDPDRRRSGDARSGRLAAFGARPGVILLQRPMHAETFVSVVRAAVQARRKQYELRDQLEARAKAEERARTLANEMKHRVKNAFTVANVIAAQSFRHARSLEEAKESFTGRLTSMARAQDLLEAEEDRSIDFQHLVEQTLEPYSIEKGTTAFQMEGPEVSVPARMASAFAMALHELATNAAKYGALSVSSGRVMITWRTKVDESDSVLLDVTWCERGGPPVSPPQRRGYGSLLVEKALTHDLAGTAQLSFEPEGLVCTIHSTIEGRKDQQR